jgi:hypothetical protein
MWRYSQSTATRSRSTCTRRYRPRQVWCHAGRPRFRSRQSGSRSFLDQHQDRLWIVCQWGCCRLSSTPFAARARPKHARVGAHPLERTVDGRWVRVEAAPLEGHDADRSAVALRCAPPVETFDLLATAYQLTRRERELVAALLAGVDMRAIVQRLFATPSRITRSRCSPRWASAAGARASRRSAASASGSSAADRIRQVERTRLQALAAADTAAAGQLMVPDFQAARRPCATRCTSICRRRLPRHPRGLDHRALRAPRRPVAARLGAGHRDPGGFGPFLRSIEPKP